MRPARLTTILCTLALLAGCATTGPQFEPASGVPPDRALVYVYREAGFVGGGLSYMVRANDAEVSTLPAGGYFVYHAAPGEIEFSAKTEARTSVTIDAEAGGTYYIKGTVGVGVFVGHPHLVVVPNDVGAKEIAECKLVPGARSDGTAPPPTGSGGPFNNVVVAIAPAEIVASPPGAPAVPVETVDRRTKIVLERTTIGHTAMSGVELQPGEIELIRSIVAAQLQHVAAALPAGTRLPPVTCEVTEFAVTTPATMLYWDATTNIAVTLRMGEQQRILAGRGVKRTYAWPSAEVLKTAAVSALKQFATASEAALREMAAAVPK